MKKRQQQVSNLPDLEVMNTYFANFGSKLLSEVPDIHIKMDIETLEKKMFEKFYSPSPLSQLKNGAPLICKVPVPTHLTVHQHIN